MLIEGIKRGSLDLRGDWTLKADQVLVLYWTLDKSDILLA